MRSIQHTSTATREKMTMNTQFSGLFSPLALAYNRTTLKSEVNGHSKL